jgi:hypothetical protein
MDALTYVLLPCPLLQFKLTKENSSGQSVNGSGEAERSLVFPDFTI